MSQWHVIRQFVRGFIRISGHAHILRSLWLIRIGLTCRTIIAIAWIVWVRAIALKSRIIRIGAIAQKSRITRIRTIVLKSRTIRIGAIALKSRIIRIGAVALKSRIVWIRAIVLVPGIARIGAMISVTRIILISRSGIRATIPVARSIGIRTVLVLIVIPAGHIWITIVWGIIL